MRSSPTKEGLKGTGCPVSYHTGNLPPRRRAGGSARPLRVEKPLEGGLCDHALCLQSWICTRVLFTMKLEQVTCYADVLSHCCAQISCGRAKRKAHRHCKALLCCWSHVAKLELLYPTHLLTLLLMRSDLDVLIAPEPLLSQNKRDPCILS